VLIVALFNEGSEGEQLSWLRVTLYAWLYLKAISLVMQNRQLWQQLLVAVVLVAGLSAWASLVQALIIEQHGLGYRAFRLSDWGWHGLADFDNPIVSALYFGICALIAAHLVMRARGITRGLCLAALVGMLVYQYFTYSRGVWAGVFVGLAALYWFVLSRRVLGITLIVAMPVAAVLLFILGRAGGLNLSYRGAIFDGWVTQLDTFWLWGSGAGADANICIESIKKCFNQAHSLYLQFFFEYGLLGLILLLALVGLLLLKAWRYRMSDSMVQLGLAMMVFTLVVSVANFYEIFLHPGVFWMVFWLPVGILFAVSATPRNKAEKSPSGAE
jgi:hypothetical protein